MISLEDCIVRCDVNGEGALAPAVHEPIPEVAAVRDVQPQATEDQSEVVAFLGSPRGYVSRDVRVEMHQTHGAYVFLVGDEAYKIKRAVRYPYMDFSTLERRQMMIEREFEINQRHAPEIYIGVVPITRSLNGDLDIGGTGTVVEWALHMRRFEQSDLLSAMADRGALTPALCRVVTDVVYESHRRAPQVPIEQGGRAIARIIEEVAEGLAIAETQLGPPTARPFRGLAEAALQRAASCLGGRARVGYVRRCHGDLHLSNIVLWKGAPTLFDAIEFNDEIATIDTLYDLAFLLMDLEHRGARGCANQVLNRYLWRSGARLDLQGLVALPLFLGLRSAVRAMVRAQRAAQAPDPEAAREREAARSYLVQALSHLQPPPPQLVAVGGLSGSGKSMLAAALAPHLGPSPGALHLRTDLERKALLGVAETVRLPVECYTRSFNETVYARVLERARISIAAGHSVVVDAVFSSPQERTAVERIASDLAAPFTGLWLTAPRETLLARVTARTDDASDATPAVVELQHAQEIGAVDWQSVDASGTPEATKRAGLTMLASRQSDSAHPKP